MAKPVRKPRTRAHFATEIATQWQRSREAIFAVGRLLIAAKKQLKHGEFTAMVENDLPFSSRTAQRLMAIARDKRMAKATHASHLPVCWSTLAEIAPELTGHGLPLNKCEAYNRVYDQPSESH